MMRLALSVLLVAAMGGTASATEYLWCEVVSGDVTIVNQGPGEVLEFEAEPGTTVTIGAFMTDEGVGLRGYGFELDTTADMVGSNLAPDASGLWTSSGGSAGVGPLVWTWALSATVTPILGDETATAPMIMSFDLTINGSGYIDGQFITTAARGDGSVWGAYYSEAYVGETYLPADQAFAGIGHYDDYDFGNIIHVTPEPAAIALLGLGVGAILRRR